MPPVPPQGAVREQRRSPGSPAPRKGLCPQRPPAARGRTAPSSARPGPHSGLALTCRCRTEPAGTGKRRTAPDFTGPRRRLQIQASLLSTVGTRVPKYSHLKETPSPPIWEPLWHHLSWDQAPSELHTSHSQSEEISL